MADPLLLVPGTGGTQLLKNGKSLGHPKVLDGKLWLLKTLDMSIEQTVLDMSMRHIKNQLRPELTTLAENATVAAGSVLTAAYNLIEQKVGETFCYDWRGDIEFSALQLLDHLRSKQAPGRRYRIVNHSQGGLVTLAASKLCEAQDGPGGFSKLVSRIVFLGTPIYGTLNAAHALLVGSDLGDSPKAEFRRIAASWPALYQMLPDFAALRDSAGAVSNFTFLNTHTYAAYPEVDLDLVRRAFFFRKKFFSSPASALAGIEYRFIFGGNKPTWEFATRKDDGTISFGDRTPNAGDSLVPFKVTQKLADSVIRERSEVVGPNENTAEHAMMLTDDFYVTRTLGILK